MAKTYYRYKTGRYLREKLATKHGCTNEYRVVPVPKKEGRKVLVCITKKKGPRGGRTKASLLGSYKGKRLLKKAKVKKMKRRRKKNGKSKKAK